MSLNAFSYDRKGEQIFNARTATSYGTASDAKTPEESNVLFIYIDEASGQALGSPIIIVFESYEAVKQFAVDDLMEQAKAIFGDKS